MIIKGIEARAGCPAGIGGPAVIVKIIDLNVVAI